MKAIKQSVVDSVAGVSEMDWARLSAYIDGEGCIQINVAGGQCRPGAVNQKFTPHITIANADPRLILWLKSTFGGKTYVVEKPNPKWRTAFWWKAHADLTIVILQRCMPYFVIKQEQAKVVLAIADTLQSNKKLVPPEIAARRIELSGQLSELKHRDWPITEEFVN